MEIIKAGQRPKMGDFVYVVQDYTSFTYKDANGNCKHCYLDNMSSLCYTLKDADEKKQAEILELFKSIFDVNSKVTFGVNLTRMEYIETLKKHFTLISCVEVPTGYGSRQKQYHAIFFTNSMARDYGGTYRDRLNKEGVIVSTMKHRKTINPGDKIDTVINESDIEKIMSYKSKYHLQKFLRTKIN